MVDLRAILAGAVVAGSFAGSTLAIESDSFVYASRQNGYLSISPGELQPIDAQSAANFRGGSQLFTSATDGVRACGQAPLHLPQGSVVKNVKLQYSVGGAGSQFLLFQIFRRAVFSNDGFSSPDQYEYLVGKNYSNSGGSVVLKTEESFQEYSKIDNQKYFYTLRVCTDFAANIFSAQVRYTYKNAGE